MSQATFTRTVLRLSEGQRALRALRPSYRSTKLPLKIITQRTEAFTRDASGYCLIPVEHHIPVFVRSHRVVQH